MVEFLPGADRVRRRPELAPDLAVICDAATLERVGRIATEEAEWFAGARILNVDHHISSSYYGDLNLVDPAAAATVRSDVADVPCVAKLASAASRIRSILERALAATRSAAGCSVVIHPRS